MKALTPVAFVVGALSLLACGLPRSGTNDDSLTEEQATPAPQRSNEPSSPPIKRPAKDRCVANATRLYYDEKQRYGTIGDLDGDDNSEAAALQKSGNHYRLELALSTGGMHTVEFDTWGGYFISVEAADVNDDGTADLVVGMRWASRVFIFLGPLASNGVWNENDADHTFAAETHGGLANLYGEQWAVVDANGDDVTDIVIFAPGEGEEACFGQDPPQVFFGPFTAKTPGPPTLLLGPDNVCLGEKLECGAKELRAFDRFDKCHAYALPLDGKEPTSCSASR